MKSWQRGFQVFVSLLTIIFTVWLMPPQAPDSLAGASYGIFMPPGQALAPSNVQASLIAQAMAWEQRSRKEPLPVKLGKPLPPGTVTRQDSSTALSYVRYLPFILSGTETSQELALHPSVWMQVTQNWAIYEQSGIVVRYPQNWMVDRLSATTDGTSGLQGVLDTNTIQVTVEWHRAEQEQIPPDVVAYQQIGYSVNEVTVKAVRGWQILPKFSDDGFCQQVVVDAPNVWVRFLLKPTRGHSRICGATETFSLVLSSLQIVAGEQHAGESVAEELPSPRSIPEDLAAAAINYDRIAAYNYAYNWYDVFDNSDGYHYWCGTPHVDPPCDGAHFLAHIMQAGGAPIHWNATPQQGHSDPIVFRINDQRAYVLSSSWAHESNVNNMEVGDMIYLRPTWDTNYCWGEAVVDTSTPGAPLVAVHSLFDHGSGVWTSGAFGLRYDIFACPVGTGAQNMYHSFVHIDTSLKLTSGLDLIPSAQQTDVNVTAEFTIRNDSGQTQNVDVRVRVNGSAPDFATRSISLGSGQSYNYSEARAFTDSGTFQACAQMNDGSGWEEIPAAGATQTPCRTLDILDPEDIEIQLNEPLALNPAVVEYPYDVDVRATFGAIHANTSGNSQTFTVDFRARVSSGSVQFDEVQDVTLNPGNTYDYDQTAHFTEPGLYEVKAEQRPVSEWVAILGDGSAILRVMAPKPDDIENKIGEACYTCGYWGDPTNTGTGNYAYGLTAMSDPTPGLPLEATWWYNAINAPDVVGPFGYGTSWLYGTWISWRPDKTAVAHMYDGHTVYFIGEVNQDDHTDMSGVYHCQDPDLLTLERLADGTAIMVDISSQITYTFDSAGRLTRINHPYPAEITLTYNGGRLTQIAHSIGVIYTVTYNTNGYIEQIASNTGRSVSFTYTPAGDLASMTRADGSTYTYEYDTNHRLTAARDPNGHPYVRNVYDAEGRVIRQYDQTGGEYLFNYGASLTSTRVFTDPLGNHVVHIYDDQYRLITEIDEMGYTTTRTYDTDGNVTAMQDKNDGLWQYTYDGRRNRTSETDPLGNTRYYAYDAHNNMISYIDALGNSWMYDYDAGNHLTCVTDPLGYTHEYRYDANGYLIWEKDEAGRITQYEYNALGFQTAIIDANGNTTHMAYDEWGNQTAYTDTLGHVATFTYDELNRLVTSTDPMGNTSYLFYDDMGNLITQTNALGDSKTYVYDDHDRIIMETDFNGNPTYYAYDALGHKTTITDAWGYTEVYTYNARGEVIARQDKAGDVTTMEYDGVGNLVREIDPLGRVTEYVYDDANHQIEVRRPCAVCPGGVAVTQKEYDAAGHLVREVDPRGAVTEYDYDPLGRRAIMTDTYGATTTYTYDPAGRLIQEVDKAGAVTRYEYGLSSQPITITNALGYQSFNYYDDVGRLILSVDERGYATAYAYDANDNLIAVTDALGNITTHTYDAGNRRLTTTDPLSRTTSYTYDANGNPLCTIDPRGNATCTAYDALNRPVTRTDALGNVTTMTYDPLGHLVAETNPLNHTRVITYDVVGRRIAEQTPLGHTTVYTYDVADNLTARREPDGALWQFEHDEAGNQIRTIDPLGNIWEKEYDLLGQVVRETDPMGGTIQNTYDAAGRLVARADQHCCGAPTTYAYDLMGRQTVITNALGFTRVSAYDGAGNLVAFQDEMGNVTTYIYDPRNQQIAETDPLGATRYTMYDAAGQMVATVDYEGYATQYVYDDAGNPIQVIAPFGNATLTEYDEMNRPVAITDPLGRTRTIAYNPLGQIVQETTPDGYTTSYGYDADGRQITRTDALGYTWHTEYDAAGRPVREVDPLGRVTTTTYDLLGRVVGETDALGRTTRMEYNPLGRLTAVIGPDGTTQRYIHDLRGNVLSEQDGNGNITRYQYDPLNQLVRKVDPLGHAWTYEYDPCGNQTDIYTPEGHHIHKEYDAPGRLVAKWHDGELVATYAYSPNGNRVEMTDATGTTTYAYDALNRLIASTDAEGHTVRYAYDEAGQKITLMYPDGRMAHFTYDADGYLAQVQGLDGTITSYERDGLGRPVAVRQGNGVLVTYTYNPVGNTVEIVQRGANGTILARHQYTADAANRRVREVEMLPQSTVTTDYTYDDLDRLIGSVASDGRETHYAFDGAGNRIRMWGTRLREDTLEVYEITYAYNAANQLRQDSDSVLGITTYIYDADSNRTGLQTLGKVQHYVYDAENHLVEARILFGQTDALFYKDDVYERYIYDGDGRRAGVETISADSGDIVAERAYLYDNATGWDVLQVYEETEDGGNTDSAFLNDRFLHKLAYWQDGQVEYFQNDVLGSVLGTTDGSGAAVAPEGFMRYGDYGEMLGPESALPTGDSFTGYERDAYTGLYYARNRYYDAISGTFITSDPYPLDHIDLLDLHRYLYVQADPLNAVDPLGLFGMCTMCKSPSMHSGLNQTISQSNHSTGNKVSSKGNSAFNQSQVSYQQAVQIGISGSVCGILPPPSTDDEVSDAAIASKFDQLLFAPLINYGNSFTVKRTWKLWWVDKWEIEARRIDCKSYPGLLICVSAYLSLTIQRGTWDITTTVNNSVVQAGVAGFTADRIQIDNDFSLGGWQVSSVSVGASASVSKNNPSAGANVGATFTPFEKGFHTSDIVSPGLYAGYSVSGCVYRSWSVTSVAQNSTAVFKYANTSVSINANMYGNLWDIAFD